MKSDKLRNPSARATSSSRAFSSAVRRMLTCRSRFACVAGLGGFCPSSSKVATATMVASTVLCKQSTTDLPSAITYGISTVRPRKPTEDSGSITIRYVAATFFALRSTSLEKVAHLLFSLDCLRVLLIEFLNRLLDLLSIDIFHSSFMDGYADRRPPVSCENMMRPFSPNMLPSVLLKLLL